MKTILAQALLGLVEAELIFEAVCGAAQDVAAFGAADPNGALEHVLEECFGREALFPVVLKIQKQRNLVEAAILGCRGLRVCELAKHVRDAHRLVEVGLRLGRALPRVSELQLEAVAAYGERVAGT